MSEPEPTEPSIRESGDEARAGATTGHMRYVLLISIVLAIGILSAIVWVPRLFSQ